MQCEWCHDEMQRTKSKTKDKNPTTEEITYRISRKGKSWSYEYGKLYPGRYNTPPLQEDLVPRSKDGTREKRKRKRRGKAKLLLWQTSETTNLERLNERKERIQGRWTRLKTLRYQRGTRNIARTFVGWRIWNKSLTDQKEYGSTPVEKRNKEHHVNLGVCKAMNDENNGWEVHASTPVETRCTRNDNDQLR